MNLRYLAAQKSHAKNNPGVFKKINDQVRCMEDLGISVEIIDLTLEKKWKRALPFTTTSLKWDTVNIDKTVDVVYIRYILSDNVFLAMLKRFKQQNPNVKIIVELPTYPYEREQTLKQIPLIIKDRIYRNHLYKYVDRIVCFDDRYKEIFKIPVISTINGIVVDNIHPKKTCEPTSTINVLAVAALAKWHGYDRFLNGMGEYYKKGGARDIHFHVVGDGEELSIYKEIAQKYEIQNHVTFYGVKTGQDLDEIYDKCEIGLASLGLHRLGLFMGSFLKTREYLAKGLPMITACDIDILGSGYPYYYQFSANESPVDIEMVADFYDNIYCKSGKSKQEIIDEIRDFAYKACDMKVAMKPIIDYITMDSPKI